MQTMKSVGDFLTQKFLQWQEREGERKTVEEFAALFGASRSLVTAWMNNRRAPTEEYRKRIIELYGEEAIKVFGGDPELYAIQQNWEYLTPEDRRNISEQAIEKAHKNDARRTHQKRTTRTAD